MKKRVGEVEEFEFETLTLSGYGTIDQQLHISIAITGWLTDDDPDNVVRPWQCLSVSREQYALRYETKYLIEMGQALEYILSMAVSMATQEALKYTILSSKFQNSYCSNVLIIPFVFLSQVSSAR